MIDANNILGMSNAEIVRSRGEQIRDYHLNANLTQPKLTGKANNIMLCILLSLFRIMGWMELINELFPPLPLPTYMLSKFNTKKPNHVCHAK